MVQCRPSHSRGPGAVTGVTGPTRPALGWIPRLQWPVFRGRFSGTAGGAPAAVAGSLPSTPGRGTSVLLHLQAVSPPPLPSSPVLRACRGTPCLRLFLLCVLSCCFVLAARGHRRACSPCARRPWTSAQPGARGAPSCSSPCLCVSGMLGLTPAFADALFRSSLGVAPPHVRRLLRPLHPQAVSPPSHSGGRGYVCQCTCVCECAHDTGLDTEDMGTVMLCAFVYAQPESGRSRDG